MQDKFQQMQKEFANKETIGLAGIKDTDKIFVQKALKEFVRALVRCYEINLDAVRHDDAAAVILPPSQSVPEGIVT